MGKAIEIKRKKRHDSTRIKGARDPVKVRRRLNRFRNKQRSMSKNWDARLENEPQGQADGRPNSRQAPRGVENQLEMAAALKSSGDPMLNNPYPNEESSDEGAVVAHNPFPNEVSSDEGSVSHNPFPNELSSDEGPAAHNPFPNEESSDEGVGQLQSPDENLFSHTGQPTSAPIASSTTRPPDKPDGPSKNSSPSEDGPAPSGPSSPKEPPTPKEQSPSGPSLPTIPTISVPTLSQPNRPSVPSAGQPSRPSVPSAGQPSRPSVPSAGQPSRPSVPSAGQPSRPSAPNAGQPSRPSAPNAGQPSRPSAPTAPTDSQYPDVPSAPSRPTVPIDSQYPDVPSAGSPSAPSSPTVETGDPTPSTPSQDTGHLTPSADPPLVEGPGGPDGLPPRDGPTVAPSPSFDSNPIPVPGAPTKPHKPTLPPAYFNPDPTPRPTKFRPTVPAPAIPTRRPTKSTRRPTFAPSVMQKEPPRPTAAKKTKRPTIISPVAYDTESPTFKYGMSKSPTRKPASPDEFPSPDEVPLPTFPPQLPPTGEPSDPPTDPPTYSPTQQPTFKPTDLPSNFPTNTTAEPTATPSSLPTPFCKADEEGNYGFPTAPQEQVIEYQYQVETTASVTEEDLNNVILPEMEKDISDVLVPALFFRNGECTGGVTAESRTSELGNAIIQDIEQYDKRTAQKWAMNILQQRERDHYQKPKGGRTDGWETSSSGGQRRLKVMQARQVQESDELVGLTAAPPDFVIRDSLGRLQNACPFPVTGTGPDGQPLECWVIEGRLTVYGFGDLGWVEPVVEGTLNEAMENGAFDNGAVNSNVIYVRSIPPGTELVIPPDGAEGENNQSQSEGTPVWAWVLIGLGIFGVVLSVVYLILKRRQSQEDFEREKAETDFFAAEGGGGAGGEGGEGDENAKLVASSGASLYSGQYKNEYGEQKEEDVGNAGGNEGVEQVYEEPQGGYEEVPEDEANPPAPAGGG